MWDLIIFFFLERLSDLAQGINYLLKLPANTHFQTRILCLHRSLAWAISTKRNWKAILAKSPQWLFSLYCKICSRKCPRCVAGKTFCQRRCCGWGKWENATAHSFQLTLPVSRDALASCNLISIHPDSANTLSRSCWLGKYTKKEFNSPSHWHQQNWNNL